MFNQRAFLVCEFLGKSARICCCDAVSVTSTKQIGVIPFFSFNLCLCHLLVKASALGSFACFFPRPFYGSLAGVLQLCCPHWSEPTLRCLWLLMNCCELCAHLWCQAACVRRGHTDSPSRCHILSSVRHWHNVPLQRRLIISAVSAVIKPILLCTVPGHCNWLTRHTLATLKLLDAILY